MTLSEEFASLLELLDLGTYSAAGGTIFLLASPPSPDRAITIAPYGGASEADSRLPWDEPKYQFKTRALGPTDAEADAQAIYDALHGLGPRALPGGTWLQLIVALQQGPTYIGQDANGRHQFTVNVRAEVRRTTANRT